MRKLIGLIVAMFLVLSSFGAAFGDDVAKTADNCGEELYKEVASGNAEKVKAIIAKGCNVNYMDVKEEATPLIKALLTKNNDMAKLLLEKGADPNINQKGKTALIVAIFARDEEMIKLLLEKGADPNVKGATGITALGAARMLNNPDIVKMIEDAGAEE